MRGLYAWNYVILVCYIPGPSCSKLMTSLVNISIKFKTFISGICQFFFFFFVEKNAGSFSAKAFLIFQQKISVYLVIRS